MKILMLIALLITGFTISYAQQVSNHLITYEREVHSLFSSKKKSITASLQQVFEHDKTDTTYHIKFSASRLDIEKSGSSFAFGNIAGILGTAKSQVNYDFVKSEGIDYFNVQEASKLLECLKSSNIIMTEYKEKKYKYPSISTCICSNTAIETILENDKPTRHVVSVGGGEAIFEMNTVDFTDLRLFLFKALNLIPSSTP